MLHDDDEAQFRTDRTVTENLILFYYWVYKGARKCLHVKTCTACFEKCVQVGNFLKSNYIEARNLEILFIRKYINNTAIYALFK